jgi:hypothetical protein
MEKQKMISFGFRKQWQPFEFWEYTTVVLERFFELEPGWRPEDEKMRKELSAFREGLLFRFNEAGIKCRDDNKIAFGLKHETTGQIIYIGFYDGSMSIGSSIRADSYLRPIRKAAK